MVKRPKSAMSGCFMGEGRGAGSGRALACLETVKFEFSLVDLVDRPPELLGRFSEFAKKFDYDARKAAAQARAG